MDFELKVDGRDFKRSLTRTAKDQIPFATAQALNGTAFEARKALRKEAGRVFDSPVKFTKDAFLVEKTTKKDGEIASKVYVHERADDYLHFQIRGGTREPGDAGTFKRAGAVIPVDGGLDTNASGNFPRGKVLSLLKRLARDQKRREVRERKRRRRGAKRLSYQADPADWERTFGKPSVFIGRPDHMPSAPYGIWERPAKQVVDGRVMPKGNPDLRLLVQLDRATDYRARLDFLDVCAETFKGDFAKRFNRELRKAIANAKPKR